MEKKKKQLLITSIIGVFMLGLMISAAVLNRTGNKNTYRTRAEQALSVGLKFDKDSVVAPVNTDFTTTIKVAAGAYPVQGYSFGLDFDKNQLQVKSIEYKVGVVSAGIGDDTKTVSTVNSRGYMHIQGEVQEESGKVISTDMDLVTLTFTVKTTTGSSIKLSSIVPPQIIKLESTGQLNPVVVDMSPLTVNQTSAVTPTVPAATATTAPSGTRAPTATPGPNIGFTFKLRFQGIQRKPEDKYNKMTVKLTLVDSQNSSSKITANTDFSTDGSGIWTGSANFAGASPSKTYKILVKGPKHIQKKICNIAPTESTPGAYHCEAGNVIALTSSNMTLDFSGILLFVGDLPPQDGVVDSYDLSLIRNCIKDNPTSNDCVTKADVNLDGRVDAQDYALEIAALSVRYDEEE